MAQLKTKYIENLAITTAKIAAANVTGAKIETDVALAGNPTTTTQTAGNNTTRLATTEFVTTAVNAGSAGLSWKNPVRQASAGSVADLSSITVANFDGQAQGITLVEGDRVLVKDTASIDGIEGLDAKRNGIYIVGTVTTGTAPLTRTTDANTALELESAAIFVAEGASADQAYTQTADTITLETTALSFVQFTGLGQITAGTGLTKTANTLDVIGGDGITANANDLAVDLKTSGGLKIDTAQIAVEPADFAGTGLEDDGADNLRIAAAAAGDGLQGGAGSALALDLKTSAGLKIDTAQLSIEPADFAGTGLEDDGADNLRLATQGNGIAGGAGSTLSVLADITETSTANVSAIRVASTGVSVATDDSTLEGSLQGVAGAEVLRVKALGIGTTQIAADAVDKTKIAADVAGNGLTQAAGGELDVNPAAAGGLEIATDALQINVDATNGSTAVNGSNELTALRPSQEIITLIAGDITAQFIDMATTATSAASISLIPEGGIEQQQGVDYTVSLAGGVAGVTRLTFAGDLATGGDAALVNGDKLIIKSSNL